jgi:hypothetical protein
MFGSIYGKAVELFGKALLVSAFLPLLAVTAALAVSIEPSVAVDTFNKWTAKEPTEQASGAIILLFALYLLSFIVYGVRERIARFLSGGEFWVLPAIRRWRRVHFTQKELDKETRFDGPGLAVAQAVTWAKGGFGDIDRDFIYIPPKSKAKKLARDVDAILDRLQGRGIGQRISATERAELARFFVAIHRLSYLDRTAGTARVRRLRALCAARQPPIDIDAWCEDVKALDYGDIVVAYNERVWSPPLRDIQPTELGNVLIWAYAYTSKRYGIELDFLYPRLLKVIDKEYQAKIDDRQQFLDFSVILTFLAFSAAAIYAVAATFSIVANPAKHAWQPIVGAVAFFAVWASLGRGAYGLSLVAARGYVSIITSAVDLFRLPLLKQLEIALPSPAKEVEIWSRLNATILTGEFTPAPEPPPSKGLWAWLRRVWTAIAR